MGKKAEQLSPQNRVVHYGRGIRRWYKKQRSRLLRRLARKDPETTETRGIRGWAD